MKKNLKEFRRGKWPYWENRINFIYFYQTGSHSRCTSPGIKYLIGFRPEAQLPCENHLNISFPNNFYCVSSSSVTQSFLLFIFILCMCFVFSPKVDLACETRESRSCIERNVTTKIQTSSGLDRESPANSLSKQ